MNVYCEVCGYNVRKSPWGKHLKTTRHGIACGDIVVEEVEKTNSVANVEGIRCWKCSVGKMLLAMYASLIGKIGR